MMEKAIKALEKMGYTVLSVAKNTARGPDLHVKKDNIIFRVEVKKARSKKRSMSVHAVESLRKYDDLIAIIFPSGYVLIEPMEDHLRSCAECGTRSFFGIY